MQRRLAAILAADMVGYSRLMAADEQATIERQRAHRSALIDPKISQYGGRIVKTMGDGLLVEFASVVDAVQCALEIQRAMPVREAEVPQELSIRYRVGINLGDIVIDGEDVLGDGVNVAARLENLAAPGGICISDVVYQNLQGKLAEPFLDFGEQALKNMSRKIRIWRWGLPLEEVGEPEAQQKENRLPLPDKPSVAVLPFNNMSGNPEQEHFADGIAEDIITALSKVTRLFVVARNSTFTYKNKAVDIRQVGREQGVRYVLEGSVQRSGDRFRITAQLIDAVNGHHVWAQRYDRPIADFFELQDEITREVTSALQVALTEGQQATLWASGTRNLEAWEAVIQIPDLLHSHRRKDVIPARRLAQKALLLDENYASAWTMLGWTYWNEAFNGWTDNPDEALKLAKEAIERAGQLDDSDADALTLLSFLNLSLRNYDEAMLLIDRAMAMAPSNSMAPAVAANVALFRNKPQEMIPLLERARRLCPIYPAWYLGDEAYAYLLMGRFDQAITTAQEAVKIDPDYIYIYFVLAVAYAELNQMEEAQNAVQDILRIEPMTSLSTYRRSQPFEDEAILARQLDGLRKAGLPE